MRGERRGVCCARLHGATRNQGVDYLLLPIFEHLAYGALICFFLESICLACVSVCGGNFAGILMCGLYFSPWRTLCSCPCCNLFI